MLPLFWFLHVLPFAITRNAEAVISTIKFLITQTFQCLSMSGRDLSCCLSYQVHHKYLANSANSQGSTTNTHTDLTTLNHNPTSNIFYFISKTFICIIPYILIIFEDKKMCMFCCLSQIVDQFLLCFYVSYSMPKHYDIILTPLHNVNA